MLFERAPGRGILYSNHGHNRIECFTNVDWAEPMEDRRSTSGYCVFVGENLVSWKSKKQGVVSRLSVEFEYRTMPQSECEIMWLHQLLMEFGIETRSQQNSSMTTRLSFILLIILCTMN